MLDPWIDDDPLETVAEDDHRDRACEQEREPQRRADCDEEQHAERRQHHEFALREVDHAGGLPQQREAERGERIDRAGRGAGQDQMDQVTHGGSPRN